MKMLNLFLFAIGACTIAFFQSPTASNTVEARGADLLEVEEMPLPVNCPYAGYDDFPCTVADPDCTSGTFKAPLSGVGLPDLFRRLNTKTVRGNCVGNANCNTPATSDLTSAGC